MRTKQTFLLALMALSLSSYAQKITVDKISENRSTDDGYFSNRCEIDLKLSGDEVRKYKSVKIGKITKAVDQQGLDLIDPEFSGSYEDISNTAAIAKLKTKVASRKASVIKELAGEIKMYNPSESNGGIMKIKDFAKKANTNLTPALSDTKVIYITKESYEKIKKDKETTRDAEIQKLPKEAKEVALLLTDLVDAFAYVEFSGKEAVFIVEGDKSKLVDMYFENAAGKRLDGNGSMISGDVNVYYFNETIKPTFRMVLQIESPTSVKTIPFKLTNIDLP
ncbi:MAG: hypothetical protein IPL23_07910 [Saprospiraceae bacterium]|nr:hypothetical protein [Saprospiraceae bacterium]